MRILQWLEITLVWTAELVLARPTPSAKDCNTPSISFLGPRSHPILAIQTYCKESTASHTDSLRKRTFNKEPLTIPKTPKTRQKQLGAHKMTPSPLPVPPLPKKLATNSATDNIKHSKASAVIVDVDPKEGTQLIDWKYHSSETHNANEWRRSIEGDRNVSEAHAFPLLRVAAGLLAFVVVLSIVEAFQLARAKGWRKVRSHLRRISSGTAPIVLDVNMPAEALLRIDARGTHFSEPPPRW